MDVARAYDAVAAVYDERFGDELAGKPLDRALLALIVDEAKASGGLVADLGAGPGHVAAYLAARGARTLAIDLSPAMVARAAARGLDARVGDLRALPLSDGALAAAVAFYAIVHLERAELPAVFAELARVLAPGAPALLGFHLGDEAVEVDDFLGGAVALTFRFFPMAEVAAAAADAGLAVELRLERAPYPSEHPSQRGYLLVRRTTTNDRSA